MFRRILNFGVLLLTTASVLGQQADRRSRDEPDVCPEAGGRYGTCDVLLFAPDGGYVIAAGDDKVARVWPHTAAGLDTNPQNMQVLRWRAWRSAASVSQSGRRSSL